MGEIMKIAVTGATGLLGQLVIENLLDLQSDISIVALVRNTEKAAFLAEKGVEVRYADYGQPDSLHQSLVGIDRLLLISSSEVGQRIPQHQAVIDAAKATGVKFIVYTSLLHADHSPLGLAQEHIQTEAAIKESGIFYALLRNGWYSENYAAAVPGALEQGAIAGAAQSGKISSAPRSDYAQAAAKVIADLSVESGTIYELAGDEAYTLSELANMVSGQSGKAVQYHDMPQTDYAALLVKVGLPEPLAQMLADSDAGAAQGGLFDDSRTLSQLLGHPTTPMSETIKLFLA
ncbi:MAG: Quinone oxidoreductase 2 [Candidatus Celerinatantimonas neptuna]|nr:MAG: Quinone oxidoreductase 2 [Candidatus Celerinatantimonas neptuna]